MNLKLQSSLQSAVTKVSLKTAFSTLLVVLSCGFLYYSYITSSTEQAIKEELKKDITQHVESILPSFLLEEQKEALPHQIARLSRKNKGSRFLVLSSAPKDFKDCFLKLKTTTCRSDDKKQIAAFAPIAVGEQSYGYLAEIKEVQHSYTFSNLLFLAVSSLIIVFLFVVILFSSFYKLTAKTIPSDIEKLLLYTQDLLQERSSVSKPNLAFSDFKYLSKGITKLFYNYKKSQNQAVVGYFASGVLHDIKTQLQAIVSASELVEEAKGSPEKYQSRLENLYNTTQARLPELQGIIKSTLDANQELDLKPEYIDISETLEKSLQYTTTEAGFDDSLINIEKPNKPVLVNHDSFQALRLFFNLTKNAFEASAVKKSNQRVLVRIKELKDTVKIYFEDNGPGLNGNFNEVFDPFKTSKKSGVGLGLYNAQRIVAAHGWTLSAKKSKRLGGARFEIEVPMSTGATS